MDRKTAIILAIFIVTMFAAGVGMVMLMRHVGDGDGPVSGSEELAGPYLEEVERRCEDRYERYSLTDAGAEPGFESATHYLEARDVMPVVEHDRWQALIDGADSWSWAPETGKVVSFELDVTQTTAAIVDGASAPMGRSPYGFCAIDTAGDILMQYRDMAFATELEARQRFGGGDEERTVRLLGACVIMELDMGRAGGIFGHSMSIALVEQTLRRSVSRYAGAARDAQQVEYFIETLEGIEGSWLDIADNARIDGLVMETMYAGCSMPPGWRSPVGPPVIDPETQETFCALGPLAIETAWSSTHERSLELLTALGDPDPRERYRRVEALEREREQTPSWKKMLAPGDLFADLAFMQIAPHVEADMRARSLLVLVRAALAIRLAYLTSEELTLPKDEKTWASFEDGGLPLVDPVGGRRPDVKFEDDHVVLSIQSEFPGWEDDAPTLEMPWSDIATDPAGPAD